MHTFFLPHFRRLLIAFTLLSVVHQAFAELKEAEEAYLAGDYDLFFQEAADYRSSGKQFGYFAALRIHALMETGKYKQAVDESQYALKYRPRDTDLILAAHRAYTVTGNTYLAQSILEIIVDNHPQPVAITRRPVSHAQVLLLGGVDPKTVLSSYLSPTREKYPKERSVYLAIGELGLENHNKEIAGRAFIQGHKLFPDDPAFLIGMARSGLSPQPDKDAQLGEPIPSYIERALEKRSNYRPAHLLQAQTSLQEGNYEQARSSLKEIFQTNPNDPEAWTLLSALELFSHNLKESEAALEKAFEVWEESPDIFHLLGNTLFQHRWYDRGIAFLNQAAKSDPEDMDILFSLGQAQLLRGEYAEGWQNIEKVHEKDPYNVAAYNLTVLKDKIKDYPVLEKDGVRVRMSPEDSEIFGQQALNIAVRAKNSLSQKYGIFLPSPVMIELLPKQEDFSIRTFGLPGGESFLGVCTGPLITLVSPRSQLGRANWESVLWHEMAHTITLFASSNRVPRWMTEGLSVYEEREEQRGWGAGMTAQYRQRILEGEVPTIAQLNQSFASAQDIMFAYFYSSLAVEYLAEEHGFQTIRDVLTDLGNRTPTMKSLEKRTGLSEQDLEKTFLEFAQKEAKHYGTQLDWTPLSDDDYRAYREDPDNWISMNPDRYYGLILRLSQHLEKDEWTEAVRVAQSIIRENPQNREGFNPYSALAQAQRALQNPEEEKQALIKLINLDSSVASASSRILELSHDAPESQQLESAQLVLGTNPFMAKAYRTIYEVSKNRGERDVAESALRSLIALKPIDTSRLYYELALILENREPEKARRAVLKALETNPRFQPALKLLSKLPK